MWPAFLGLHVAGHVGFNLLLRRSLTAKPDPWVMSAVMQTGIAVPLLVVLLVTMPDWQLISTRDWMQIVVTAGLVVFLQFANVKALESLEASVYAVFFNLRIVFATVLGVVFLGEELVWLSVAGGLLILAAVVLVRQDQQRDVTVAGIRWGIASGLTRSVLNMSEKDLILRIGFLGYAIPAMVLAAVVLWAIVLARRTQVPRGLLRQPAMIALMGFRALSAYAMLAAFATGALLSVGTYISSLGVIVIVALGIILLKERDYLYHKLSACAVACVGLTLIYLAQS